MSTPSMISGNNNNTNNNNNSNKTAVPQQQCCTVCSAPTKLPPTSSTSASGAARVVVVCSLRCSWQTKQQCVQCGRQVKDDKLPFPDHPNFKIFCGTLCLDEARRGNWCVACGCKQVTTQGLSRCSHECMSVDVPLPHESPFPSRRTTPGENESSNNGGTTYNNNNNTTSNSQQHQQQQQQQQPLSRRASFSSTTSSSTTTTTTTTATAQSSQERRPNSRELQLQNRITCSPVEPGSKLWDRITTPFHRSGLQCFQVIQVHNTAADKKAYNAYRLSVDQNLSANGIKKYGFGGEGNEHKRFVPLMAGCGGHLYGLRLANQLPVAQHTCSASNHKEIGCEVEGYPHICQSASCDVCRILQSGMKLTSVTGRTSHFSVPTLDAVLPWCQDASASTSSNNNINQQQQQQKFQAAALIRTVLGNVHVVNDFDSVPEQAPPQGSDSVVCVEPNQNGDVSSASSAPRTDSAFNYNDRGVLCEYIVLFSS